MSVNLTKSATDTVPSHGIGSRDWMRTVDLAIALNVHHGPGQGDNLYGGLCENNLRTLSTILYFNGLRTERSIYTTP